MAKKSTKTTTKTLDPTPTPDVEAPPDHAHIAEPLRGLAVRCDSLVMDPANARKHPDKNLDAIKGSLRRFGQVKPLVVRQGSHVVVCGNGTLAAARALGWEWIAANVIDMNDATAVSLAIADNRTAELAEWDQTVLDELLATIHEDDPELQAMLDEMKTPATPNVAEDEAPIDQAAELQAKWQTSRGQLWEIPSKTVPGKVHRLLCGDSTDAGDVARVMGGERAGLMNTDPPYGIDYCNEDLHPNAGPICGRVANDKFTNEELQAFLEKAFGAAKDNALSTTAAWYLWHAMLTQGFFAAAAAAAANVVLHRQIIWVKPVLVFGRGQYHWKHELCFMGWVEGNQPPDYGLGNGERTQTTVWEIDSVNNADRKDFNHSTPKPVGLFSIPIVKHLKPGEICFEPFSGSGPQLVAAEQLGRLCRAIECEPKYVAVALERLAKLGLEPRLAD